MKVRIESGASVFWLTDDGEGCRGVSNFRVNDSSESELIPTIGADEKRPEYWGNVDNLVTFEGYLTFDTAGEAEAWLLDYDLDLPRTGDVIFVLDNDDEYVMLDAAIDAGSRGFRGVGVPVTWQLRGGLI